MKLLLLSLALLSALLVGCASRQPWRADDTPYPRSTPFDSNEFARTIYLDGFRQGYRAEMNAAPQNVDMLTGPYAGIRQGGFYAGAASARAEKAAARRTTPAP